MSINRGRKLFHSSIRLNGSKIVYIDPWQVVGEPHDADVILVTHDHHDHYSPEDIAKLSKAGTVLAVPTSMAEQAAGATVTVEPGQSYEIGGVHVDTVAAYNIGRPFHPMGKNYVGYLVDLDGVRYFIAGDTDQNPENSMVSCDVAFVPCGGKFTMDASQAAAFVNEIRPKIAVPTHYGAVTDSADAASVFCAKVDADIAVEIHE